GALRRHVVGNIHFLEEIVEEVEIVLLAEETDDILGHVLPDAVDVGELAPGVALPVACRQHALTPACEATIVARQQLRRLLSHLADAERIDEAIERDLAARFDGVAELARALLTPALALADNGGIEAEDVGGRLDELVFPEIGDVLGAEAFDIEG